MLIYQNNIEQFVIDFRENVIADKMAGTFQERLGRKPGASEFASWQNSLSRVRDLIEIAGLTQNMVALEYEVPYNQSRLDCLLFGKGADGIASISLIELKQWTTVTALEDEGNFVETYTGGGNHVVPHPSQQVRGYDRYLRNFVAELESFPPLRMFSCVYCHNYSRAAGVGLFHPTYKALIDEFPIYTKEDTRELAVKLKSLLAKGDGFEIFNRFMQSPIRPSKRLLDSASRVIKNEAIFSLLNEQLVAKNLIWSKVSKAKKLNNRCVVIVQGGPGTGKSVIALNILAEAALRHENVAYACKSKPFVEGLRDMVGGGAEDLFSNLYKFVPSRVKENQLDLLLVDEAHRVEKTSNFQYTKPEDRTDMPQIDQLVRCAKTSVFFIDDKQNVRAQEIGHSDLIRESARKFGRSMAEVTLETQFRCMGSNDYLRWLESVLGYSKEQLKLRKNEIFEFKILGSPRELYEAIKEKESRKPNSARIVAGFCWPWSTKLDPGGGLPKDVVIGDFAMPWETHDKITRVPKGYVKWYQWAYRPEGIKQVGCIYTAQGFEFDFIGVIIGNDLAYDPITNTLKADISATKDPTLKRSPATFDTHVKNIYRTLLSRGMRGCYVFFTDKATEQFFRSRLE